MATFQYFPHTEDDVRTMLPVMQSDIMLTYNEKTLIIDAKYYSDLIFSLGYKSVILISTEEVRAKPEDMTWEDALWEIGARDNKVECAFEVTKEDPYRYAKCACGRFLSNCKRWGVDPEEIMNG